MNYKIIGIDDSVALLQVLEVGFKRYESGIDFILTGGI